MAAKASIKKPVVVTIFSTSNSMYFATRTRITNDEVASMRGIEGVTRVDGVPSQYWVLVNYATAFSYQEIAPQILLGIADILEVSIAELDVTPEPNMLSLSEHKNLDWLIQAATKLEFERWRRLVVEQIEQSDIYVTGMRQCIKDARIERGRLQRVLKKMDLASSN